MKKIGLILIATLMFQNVLNSQTCLEEGITFHDQAGIDNFALDYPDCIEILGDVAIGNGYDNDITNLNGLSNIQVIGGYLYFNENSNLENMNGLDNLESIGGYLEIYGNTSLSSLSGLGSLQNTGGDLIFYENHAIENFNGLNALSSVGGKLEIGYHEILSSFSGLESLSSTGGLEMGYVANITDFSGLNALQTINGNVFLSSCDGISSTNGLNSLTEVNGELFFNGLISLASLNGLENLSSVGGNLRIGGCPVTNLGPLGNLSDVGDNLIISGCNALTSLTGLEGLTSIGGELEIGGNQSLTSLSGVDNIDHQSITNLKIRYNPMLSECEVQSVCEYLLAPTGTVWLFDNASGCSSQDEVEAACESSDMAENILFDDLIVCPNPFSQSVDFSYHLDKPQWIKLSIVDQIGREVYSLHLHQEVGLQKINWKAKELASGVYFYTLTGKDKIINGKILPQK